MIIKEIDRRLDLVELFTDDLNLSNQIRKLLSSVKDIERCLLRLHYNSSGLNDFLNIVTSLEIVSQISLLLITKLNTLVENSNVRNSLILEIKS